MDRRPDAGGEAQGAEEGGVTLLERAYAQASELFNSHDWRFSGELVCANCGERVFVDPPLTCHCAYAGAIAATLLELK